MTEFFIAIISILFILVFYLIYIIYKKNIEKTKLDATISMEHEFSLYKELQKGMPLKSKIPHLCMGKTVYLIDYENVGTIPKAIFEDKDSIIFIFVGKYQKDAAMRKKNLIDTNNNFYYIYLDTQMHNYLDIYMACWVGSIISTYTPNAIYILSADKGYKALIEAVKKLGFLNIQYLIINPSHTIQKTKINKMLKDILILYSNNTISYKSFKSSIKKIEPQWNIDEIKYFINKAEDLHYINHKKIGNINYIEINKSEL